jgi:hypothetical protein
MTFKRSAINDNPARERRSGLNRRWIKAPYDGNERRSGQDRRGVSVDLEPVELLESQSQRSGSLENLLFSTTLRLEALARLLIAKGLLSHRELADMLQAIQNEYPYPQLKKDR